MAELPFEIRNNVLDEGLLRQIEEAYTNADAQGGLEAVTSASNALLLAAQNGQAPANYNDQLTLLGAMGTEFAAIHMAGGSDALASIREMTTNGQWAELSSFANNALNTDAVEPEQREYLTAIQRNANAHLTISNYDQTMAMAEAGDQDAIKAYAAEQYERYAGDGSFASQTWARIHLQDASRTVNMYDASSYDAAYGNEALDQRLQTSLEHFSGLIAAGNYDAAQALITDMNENIRDVQNNPQLMHYNYKFLEDAFMVYGTHIQDQEEAGVDMTAQRDFVQRDMVVIQSEWRRFRESASTSLAYARIDATSAVRAGRAEALLEVADKDFQYNMSASEAGELPLTQNPIWLRHAAYGVVVDAAYMGGDEIDNYSSEELQALLDGRIPDSLANDAERLQALSDRAEDQLSQTPQEFLRTTILKSAASMDLQYAPAPEEITEEQMVTNPDWIRASMTLALYDNDEILEKFTDDEVQSILRGQIPEAMLTEPGETQLRGRARTAVEGDTRLEQLSEYGLNVMGQDQFNLTSTIGWAMRLNDNSPETQALLHGRAIYEALPMFSLSGTGRLVKGILTDPTTYVGVGLFAKGLNGVRILGPMAIAGAEGMIYGSVDDYARQSTEIVGGQLQERDFMRTAIAGGIGLGAGAVLGGAADTIIRPPAFIRNRFISGRSAAETTADEATTQAARVTDDAVDTAPADIITARQVDDVTPEAAPSVQAETIAPAQVNEITEAVPAAPAADAAPTVRAETPELAPAAQADEVAPEPVDALKATETLRATPADDVAPTIPAAEAAPTVRAETPELTPAAQADEAAPRVADEATPEPAEVLQTTETLRATPAEDFAPAAPSADVTPIRPETPELAPTVQADTIPANQPAAAGDIPGGLGTFSPDPIGSTNRFEERLAASPPNDLDGGGLPPAGDVPPTVTNVVERPENWQHWNYNRRGRFLREDVQDPAKIAEFLSDLNKDGYGNQVDQLISRNLVDQDAQRLYREAQAAATPSSTPENAADNAAPAGSADGSTPTDAADDAARANAADDAAPANAADEAAPAGTANEAAPGYFVKLGSSVAQVLSDATAPVRRLLSPVTESLGLTPTNPNAKPRTPRAGAEDANIDPNKYTTFTTTEAQRLSRSLSDADFASTIKAYKALETPSDRSRFLTDLLQNTIDSIPENERTTHWKYWLHKEPSILSDMRRIAYEAGDKPADARDILRNAYAPFYDNNLIPFKAKHDEGKLTTNTDVFTVGRRIDDIQGNYKYGTWADNQSIRQIYRTLFDYRNAVNNAKGDQAKISQLQQGVAKTFVEFIDGNGTSAEEVARLSIFLRIFGLRDEFKRMINPNVEGSIGRSGSNKLTLNNVAMQVFSNPRVGGYAADWGIFDYFIKQRVTRLATQPLHPESLGMIMRGAQAMFGIVPEAQGGTKLNLGLFSIPADLKPSPKQLFHNYTTLFPSLGFSKLNGMFLANGSKYIFGPAVALGLTFGSYHAVEEGIEAAFLDGEPLTVMGMNVDFAGQSAEFMGKAVDTVGTNIVKNVTGNFGLYGPSGYVPSEIFHSGWFSDADEFDSEGNLLPPDQRDRTQTADVDNGAGQTPAPPTTGDGAQQPAPDRSGVTLDGDDGAGIGYTPRRAPSALPEGTSATQPPASGLSVGTAQEAAQRQLELARESLGRQFTDGNGGQRSIREIYNDIAPGNAIDISPRYADEIGTVVNKGKNLLGNVGEALMTGVRAVSDRFGTTGNFVMLGLGVLLGGTFLFNKVLPALGGLFKMSTWGKAIGFGAMLLGGAWAAQHFGLIGEQPNSNAPDRTPDVSDRMRDHSDARGITGGDQNHDVAAIQTPESQYLQGTSNAAPHRVADARDLPGITFEIPVHATVQEAARDAYNQGQIELAGMTYNNDPIILSELRTQPHEDGAMPQMQVAAYHDSGFGPQVGYMNLTEMSRQGMLDLQASGQDIVAGTGYGAAGPAMASLVGGMEYAARADGDAPVATPTFMTVANGLNQQVAYNMLAFDTMEEERRTSRSPGYHSSDASADAKPGARPTPAATVVADASAQTNRPLNYAALLENDTPPRASV